jgi:hypothetical protein
MYNPANNPHTLQPPKQLSLSELIREAEKHLVTHYKRDHRIYVSRCRVYPDVKQGIGETKRAAREHFLENLRQALSQSMKETSGISTIAPRKRGRPKKHKQRLQVYVKAQTLAYFESTAERLCLQPSEMFELVFEVFRNVQQSAAAKAMHLESKGIAAANKHGRGERLTSEEQDSLARFHRGDAIWDASSYSLGK